MGIFSNGYTARWVIPLRPPLPAANNGFGVTGFGGLPCDAEVMSRLPVGDQRANQWSGVPCVSLGTVSREADVFDAVFAGVSLICSNCGGPFSSHGFKMIVSFCHNFLPGHIRWRVWDGGG